MNFPFGITKRLDGYVSPFPPLVCCRHAQHSSVSTFRRIALFPRCPGTRSACWTRRAGAKLLFRWLGRLVSHPEWTTTPLILVATTTRTLQDLICYPHTQRIKETLADNGIAPPTHQPIRGKCHRAGRSSRLGPIISRLGRRTLPHRLRRCFSAIVTCKPLRLVCVGYQRLDQEQPRVVCTIPTAICSTCAGRPKRQMSQLCGILASLRKKRKPWRRPSLSRLLAFLLLLLLLAGRSCFHRPGQHLWARYFERLE